MSMDTEHLTKHLYVCPRHRTLECTKISHARLYSTITGRGEETDIESFNSASSSEVEKMIGNMGFTECKSPCPVGKHDRCFFRQTSWKRLGDERLNCPVCNNILEHVRFTIDERHFTSMYYCVHCKCDYELRTEGMEGNKPAWWKCTKLPVIADGSKAKYKLYEIESACTGEVVNEYPLDQFQVQLDRFADMSSGYMDGEEYELVVAREDEFEDGMPTFEMDERVVCYQGDCGKRLHLEAAKNVKRWRDVLAT